MTVATEAKTLYEDVKKDKKFRYIIYHIKDERVSIMFGKCVLVVCLHLSFPLGDRGGDDRRPRCHLQRLLGQAAGVQERLSLLRVRLPSQHSGGGWRGEHCDDRRPSRADDLVSCWPTLNAIHLLINCLFRCPESAKIKQKMLYSSSYDALKKALVGVYKYVQACDFEEASKEAIEDAFRKGGK